MMRKEKEEIERINEEVNEESAKVRVELLNFRIQIKNN